MLVFAIICATGVVFLMFSSFFADHDFGHGFDSEADGIQGFLSLKIISIFLVTCGATGVLYMNYDNNMSSASFAGFLVGCVFSILVKKFLKLIYQQQASSTIDSTCFIGIKAEVKTEIPENGIGEIACVVKGKRIYLPAKEINNKIVTRNTSVEIVQYNGDSTAIVKEQS